MEDLINELEPLYKKGKVVIRSNLIGGFRELFEDKNAVVIKFNIQFKRARGDYSLYYIPKSERGSIADIDLENLPSQHYLKVPYSSLGTFCLLAAGSYKEGVIINTGISESNPIFFIKYSHN